MSVDTSHVRPTSTDSPLNDVGVWEAFRRANSPVWAAERATRCAAIRNELDEQIVRPRTAEDALADVKRFKAMLSVPAVIASGPWTQDVERKLAGARAELGRFRRAGAR